MPTTAALDRTSPSPAVRRFAILATAGLRAGWLTAADLADWRARVDSGAVAPSARDRRALDWVRAKAEAAGVDATALILEALA